MDALLTKLLVNLASQGSGFIFAAVTLVLLIFERRRSEKLADKLAEVSMASIKADYERDRSVKTLEKAFDVAVRALGESRSMRE